MYSGRLAQGMMGGGFRILVCLIGFLIFMAVATAVVVLVVKLIKHKSHLGFHSGYNMPNNGSSNYNIFSGKALEILNERYAKGEIEDDEYARKKAELMKH